MKISCPNTKCKHPSSVTKIKAGYKPHMNINGEYIEAEAFVCKSCKTLFAVAK